MSDANKHDCENKGLAWEEINNVIKWTLKNVKHLNEADTYEIEKETDKCHLLVMQKRLAI